MNDVQVEKKDFFYQGMRVDYIGNVGCIKGEMHPWGQGKMTYLNHDVYDVYEGKIYKYPSVKGKMTYKNGDVYKGKFDDYRIKKNLDDYRSFHYGKPFGAGIMTYKNGDVFDGGWGRHDTLGIFAIGTLYKNGLKYENIELKDKTIIFNHKNTDKVKLKYPDGSVFEGEFNNNGTPVKGTITLPNKKVIPIDEGNIINPIDNPKNLKESALSVLARNPSKYLEKELTAKHQGVIEQVINKTGGNKRRTHKRRKPTNKKNKYIRSVKHLGKK